MNHLPLRNHPVGYLIDNVSPQAPSVRLGHLDEGPLVVSAPAPFGIDIDERNAGLARERCGEFFFEVLA